MKSLPALAGAALVLMMLIEPAAAQTGEVARGERMFRACAPCHSLEADRNMTGPSLGDLWNRKAGGLASFTRYSSALNASGVTWDDTTLDAWLADPQHFIVGNTMTFPGIKDGRQRASWRFSRTRRGPAARPP
jgi:cytochrome c